MKSFFLINVSLFVMLLSACSPRVPFTHQIRHQYKLNEQELKSIQFYTSDDIILRRGDKDSDGKRLEEGTLEIKKSRTMEEIVIKAGTPCIIDKVVDGERVSVKFEDGANKFLVFGSINNSRGYYTLQAETWLKSGIGRLNYGDTYYWVSKSGRNVILLFKMKQIEEDRQRQKVVGGKKVGK